MNKDRLVRWLRRLANMIEGPQIEWVTPPTHPGCPCHEVPTISADGMVCSTDPLETRLAWAEQTEREKRELEETRSQLLTALERNWRWRLKARLKGWRR